MNLSHVRLLVTNVTECFYFYRDIMGFDVIWGDENSPYAEFQTGQTKIAINQKSMIAEVVGTLEKNPESDSQDKLALIFAVDNVDETYEELVNKGVEFLNSPLDRNDWGIRLAHFRDPAGNLIEINQEK
ncbi:MAG: VOC family protein [Bacillota bacterium]